MIISLKANLILRVNKRSTRTFLKIQQYTRLNDDKLKDSLVRSALVIQIKCLRYTGKKTLNM